MNKRSPRPPLLGAPPGSQRSSRIPAPSKQNKLPPIQWWQAPGSFSVYHGSTCVTWLHETDFLIIIVIITINKHLQWWIINSQHALHSSPAAVYFQEQLTLPSTTEVFFHKPGPLTETDAGCYPLQRRRFSLLVFSAPGGMFIKCIFQHMFEMNTWSRMDGPLELFIQTSAPRLMGRVGASRTESDPLETEKMSLLAEDGEQDGGPWWWTLSFNHTPLF